MVMERVEGPAHAAKIAPQGRTAKKSCTDGGME
jgi:hypothetical protein